MRRACAVCAQYGSPDGVTFRFQVSAYSIEPSELNRVFNLFAKDDVRAAVHDEAVELGPEVAFVGEAFAFTGGAESLTGTGAGPAGLVVRPAGQRQGTAPPSDPGEEMALNVSPKIVPGNVSDTSIIYFSFWNQPVVDKLAEPLRRIRVEFIVIVHFL